MDVLKFGGTSVGSIEPLLNIGKIVSSRRESVIVVVSAMEGITDILYRIARLASEGDAGYLNSYSDVCVRHRDIIRNIFHNPDSRLELESAVDRLLAELKEKCDAVSLSRECREEDTLEIVSYGERLSSIIVCEMLEGSELYDPLSFIRTTALNGRNILDSDATENFVREAFSGFPAMGAVAVVPGFISSDIQTSRITNLGRGGSDYTASIIAASLGARSLEIWTDVDGFMTADPRIIKTSYVIDELSFEEAMELCNVGAKVIYSPALYPVYPKNIPVYVRNTFNPGAEGTVIRQPLSERHRTVTGIASIDNTCLITVSGPSMAGIVGVDSRIFTALAANGISVFLVSQSSSETHISLGIKSESAGIAREILEREFSHEISEGSMAPVKMISGLAAVAVVGENVGSDASVTGRLYSLLGRNGISIVASAQGTADRNISVMVERRFLRKSLNVIHDSFFLSEYQELNLFICGVGTVGGNLLSQIALQRQKLMRENNLKLNVVGIARSTKAVFDRDGIDLSMWRDLLEQGVSIDPHRLEEEVISMNIFNSVFVDCTASGEIASLYRNFVGHGISVVAANKITASSDYDAYASLKDLARSKGVKFLFETNVGAGLPIINTINALRRSGDRILKIEAVVSGTLNFIFNTLGSDTAFSEAVRMAMEQGYSEPDPRVDLSGRDVIRKLVILAREAGYRVSQEDVLADPLIPGDFFDCSMDEFWKRLPSLDGDFEARRKLLESRGRKWRFVASMENGKYSVGLREFTDDHPFYGLEGANNIFLFTTERYNRHPMLIQGYGAGAGVTAAGVFADVMRIANI